MSLNDIHSSKVLLNEMAIPATVSTVSGLREVWFVVGNLKTSSSLKGIPFLSIFLLKFLNLFTF